jgi:A/G-specific adenine glycosylase
MEQHNYLMEKKKRPCAHDVRATKILSAAEVRAFREKIYNYYRKRGRHLPWRKTHNPYHILVSEVMLQQTQVERVIEKYAEFIKSFPDFPALAGASLHTLLAVWQGMGYNRRALALRSLAQIVVKEHGAKLPSAQEELLSLPGIGRYTAGAVAAFAFQQPVVFMDTNIRRVFIHEFFRDRESIADTEILPLLEQTLDKSDPRSWYNALMDYGAMLKKKRENPNRRSAHYVRQSPFENSNRQVRGKILKVLLAESPLTRIQIIRRTGMDPEQVDKNILQLEKEGFIRTKDKLLCIC